MCLRIFITLLFLSFFDSSLAQKPNIIFILTDDHKYDAMGFMGNKYAITPEMDKLAQNGTHFRNAFSTTPICAASRASILASMHERTHKYTFQTADIREEYMQSAYPKVLRNAGYFTGFYGKFGVNYKQLSQLFDVHEDYDRNNAFNDRRGYFYKKIGNEVVHLTRYTGQKAIDFIENAPLNQPFCLSLSFSAPHAHDGAADQYFDDEQTAHLLKDVTIEPPLLEDSKYFDALPEEVKKGFSRLRWTWRFDNPEKYQRMVKNYYRMIAGVDIEIGKIREKLHKKGLDKNTIIVLLGDNGYLLGERGLADKWMMYENSIRVPFIVFDPRTKKKQVVDEMALNIDLGPTLSELAGIEKPKNWQGKSLMPLLKNPKSSIQRDTILVEHLWEFTQIPPSEGVRTKDWKYFRYVNNKSQEELYDLRKDVSEVNNLAKNADYKAVLNEYRSKTDQLANRFKDSFSGLPTNLTVETIREPEKVEILDSTPEFGWEVPKEAVSQAAYQILVATSLSNINNNIGDAWNSKQTRSSQSINVPYKGNILELDKTYFWKVRIWDADNRLGEYSNVQTFKIGSSTENISSSNVIEIDKIAPKTVVKTNEKAYFVDFGKDAFAHLELHYKSTKSDTLLIRLGEQLENGQINRKPTGTIRYTEIKLAVSPEKTHYVVYLKPDERNTKKGVAVQMPSSYPVLLPFRYVEIENASSNISEKDLIQFVYHIYWKNDQSHFSSSDTVLNQVFDMCKYTIKATSFAGLYVDGDRERIPYEADAYLNQLSHYTTDREYAISQNTIEYFMKHPTWPTEWQQHVALMFHADYMYTGNTELIEKYYEPLKTKTLMELAREDGLISSKSEKNNADFMKRLGFTNLDERLKDIVDWPPAQKDTGWKLATAEGERDGFVFMPYNTVINALFYKNMEIMAEFAKILGKSEDETYFRMMALKVKNAINDKLFDKKTGAYTDGEGTDHSSLHANMMVLAFDIVPEKHKKSVVEFIKTRGMACSVYGSQYLLDGLYNAGEADYALKLMNATHDRSWYNMIKIGATMTLEAWDMKYKPNSDWNHAWGATPANIIPRQMWGIQPQKAGASIIYIKPQLSSLTNSAITVPFQQGLVKANYQNKGRNKIYTIEVPANMVAEFQYNFGQDDNVILNGKRIDKAFESIRLSSGISTLEITVNSY